MTDYELEQDRLILNPLARAGVLDVVASDPAPDIQPPPDTADVQFLVQRLAERRELPPLTGEVPSEIAWVLGYETAIHDLRGRDSTLVVEVVNVPDPT